MLHIHTQLIGVRRAVRIVDAVEQNALLHRRQRIEVDDVAGRDRQRRQLCLGQRCQTEVRRCHSRLATVAAMFDQTLQLAPVGFGQRRDGFCAIHAAAEGPGQFQLTAVDLTVNAQPVTQRRCRVLISAGAFAAWHEQRTRVGVERAVELAEVVEGHARLRQSLQLGGLAQVTQHAKPDAFARHRPQLFLDRAQRRTRRRFRGQAHRKQAAEPAHGAGQVDVVEQVFTTMTFELNQYRRLFAPVTQHPRQGRQQQIIDLRAIRRWRHF
ncbi:hypothetical protein D3C72_353270 [compost metagenome]